MLKALVGLIYPEKGKCPFCGNESKGNLLCPKCSEEINRFSSLPLCHKCGRFLNFFGEHLQEAGSNCCEECKVDETPYVAARAIGPFEGVLKDAIYRLKFTGVRSIAPILASLLVEVITSDEIYKAFLENPAKSLILPVPLAKEKEKLRGFNQSSLLAEELGKTLKIAVSHQILVKNRNTPTQSKMLKAWRKENLIGAFSLQNGTYLESKRILLIDDIFTTGTTVKECCQVLKQGGASAIYIATICTGYFEKNSRNNLKM